MSILFSKLSSIYVKNKHGKIELFFKKFFYVEFWAISRTEVISNVVYSFGLFLNLFFIFKSTSLAYIAVIRIYLCSFM